MTETIIRGTHRGGAGRVLGAVRHLASRGRRRAGRGHGRGGVGPPIRRAARRGRRARPHDRRVVSRCAPRTYGRGGAARVSL